ncbi:MAG: hypothetical protein Q8Q09_00680 [Deltaproteobacteria bacterium]|nr:hypothetical protein [Deltaproteobacteria bacterium]
MKKSFSAVLEAAVIVGALALTACSPPPVTGDAGMQDSGSADAGPSAMLPADVSGYAAWLATDAYRTWRCDPMARPAIEDSPHGSNIICVNSVLDGARTGSGAWPVGSAAVKIVFDGAGMEAARFLDVRRTDAAGAAGWYFMRLPTGGMAGPAGMGDVAPASTACAGCHSGGGRDFVRRVP